MNKLYQDANNCLCYDITFPGGDVKIFTDDSVIPAGWEVTINQQYQQVRDQVYCLHVLLQLKNEFRLNLTDNIL